jgi:hypothetical protein
MCWRKALCPAYTSSCLLAANTNLCGEDFNMFPICMIAAALAAVLGLSTSLALPAGA